MQKYIFLLFLFILTDLYSQTNQEITESNKSLGFGLMISESGFGFGTNFFYQLNSTFSSFAEISVAEISDDKEFEFIDYWGNKYIAGKKNRVYLIPLNFGLQYRMFEDEIIDNFRPYISFAVGPQMIFYSPYKDMEFFKSLKYGKLKYGIGGFLGLGIYFGSTQSLQGISIRYNYTHLFDDGIESLENKPLKDISSFYVVLTFGFNL